MAHETNVSPGTETMGGALGVPAHKPRQFRHITCVVSETREHGGVCLNAVTGDLKEVRVAEDMTRQLARQNPGTVYRVARYWPPVVARVVTKMLFVEVPMAAPSSTVSAEASAGTVAPATTQGEPETPAQAGADAKVKDLF
jgi:hypothetical protein